jgi:serine/threonine protein kinase
MISPVKHLISPSQPLSFSGKLDRGISIGEGGFGQVYLCKLKDENGTNIKANDDSKSMVVKMIGADFERDVTVLQDALDEAKHLLSLKHRNVVR